MSNHGREKKSRELIAIGDDEKTFSSHSKLIELIELEKIFDSLQRKKARIRTVAQSYVNDTAFPIYAISLGSLDPKAPTIGLFAGIHGLERIGTHVLSSYLKTIDQLLSWDKTFQELLETTRLVMMPLVNPGGMFLQTRANPQGVDLMRNAPIHGDRLSPFALYGGQRISKRLPWYRGKIDAEMEVEAQALCKVVEEEILCSDVAITIDVHSGFGAVDRIWFPYARTKRPFSNIAEIFSLKLLLDKTYPNHIYTIEPQSYHYIAHGDLWDYLYDTHRQREKQKVFIPLTLELGSWIWIRKNMKQIFSLLGVFNPLKPHRLSRTLRRHTVFFEFIHRVIIAPESWILLPKNQKEMNRRRALELWYSHP